MLPSLAELRDPEFLGDDLDPEDTKQKGKGGASQQAARNNGSA